MLMTPSRSTSAEAQWEPVLRAYAALLDEHRVLLLTVGVEGVVDESVMVVPPFEPPTGMPPLPASFAGWVAALERDTQGLIDLATEYLGKIRPSAGLRLPRTSSETRSVIDWKM
jgi:hypothetical protein